MNITNLKRMADHLKTVPQAKFSMRCGHEAYMPKTVNKKCTDTNCIIGNCLHLDPHVSDETLLETNYWGWAVQFTGLFYQSRSWNWIFHFEWGKVDNTPTGAAMRIEWLLKHGIPKNDMEQRHGKASLCYKA